MSSEYSAAMIAASATGQALPPIAANNKNNICAMAFGRNYYYALGADDDVDCGGSVQQQSKDTTTEIERGRLILRSDNNNDDRIIDAACTAQSTIVLHASGAVYQTGTIHGRILPRLTRVVIPLPLKCVQVAAGRHFCLARLEGGLAVVSWGAGHFGQLGIGGNAPATTSNNDDTDAQQQHQVTYSPVPIVIERLLPSTIGGTCTSIAAGDWHAVALCGDGRVWAWGSNRSLQCGRKSTTTATNSAAPTLTAPLPVTMPDGALVESISAGKSHCVALMRGTGAVVCWGATHHGQCGLARRSGTLPVVIEGLENVVQVSAGGNHTMALTRTGRVMTWGGGTEGELGLGCAVSAQVKPRLVGDLDFAAIAAGQEWKNQQLHKLAPILTVPKITTIRAGSSYSVAVSSSGHVYTWGSNDSGQAGIATPNELPYKDNTTLTTKTSTIRELHVSTFDSRHNLLLPAPVDAVAELYVTNVACGPNHMWCFGNARNAQQEKLPVGRTLYEVQEEVRFRKLQRARNSFLNKMLASSESDDGNTDGTTTQTDCDDALEDATETTDFHDHDMLSISEMPASPGMFGPPATPSSLIHQSRSTTPMIREGFEHHDEAVPPFSPAIDVVATPRVGHRRRFSLPKLFRRMSVGKSNTNDQDSKKATNKKRDKRMSL